MAGVQGPSAGSGARAVLAAGLGATLRRPDRAGGPRPVSSLPSFFLRGASEYVPTRPIAIRPASRARVDNLYSSRYNAVMTGPRASKALKAAEENSSGKPKGACNGGFVADPAAGEKQAQEDAANAPSSVPAAPQGNYLDGLRALRRRETLWPLMLVISFFVIHHWTGLSGLRPFMVPVFRQFGLPVDAHWLTVSELCPSPDERRRCGGYGRLRVVPIGLSGWLDK